MYICNGGVVEDVPHVLLHYPMFSDLLQLHFCQYLPSAAEERCISRLLASDSDIVIRQTAVLLFSTTQQHLMILKIASK